MKDNRHTVQFPYQIFSNLKGNDKFTYNKLFNTHASILSSFGSMFAALYEFPGFVMFFPVTSSMVGEDDDPLTLPRIEEVAFLDPGYGGVTSY